MIKNSEDALLNNCESANYVSPQNRSLAGKSDKKKIVKPKKDKGKETAEHNCRFFKKVTTHPSEKCYRNPEFPKGKLPD